MNGTLNAQGDTKSYRNVLIFSFFLNIFLNPLFIFGYGFIPAFGIAGLAIATVVAQFIGLLYLAHKVYCCELKQYLKFKCFIPKFNLLGELIYQTIPVMFSMLLIGVGIFNILYFIGQFGDLATAGYGAALRIEQVFLLPVIGLNTAVLSIGGQNFGARSYDRLRELYKKALTFGSAFMICAGVIIFFGAEFLVSLFTDNLEAIKHGVIYLKVAALIGPIYPVFFITTAIFQAVKKPLYSLYMSILRLTALPFLSLWYVINIRGGNYEDIFYTILVTNWLMGIAVLMFIGYFLNNVFKQNKNFLLASTCLIFFSNYSGLKSEEIKVISGIAKVIDGDTIRIDGKKIRLLGIDAPERDQKCKKTWLTISFLSFNKDYPCGQISTNKLKNKINNKFLTCEWTNRDRYKRYIAECFKNKRSINSWMVEYGLAVAYRKYSKKFVSKEILAKKEKRGLWSGTFEMPWDYRRKN